MHKKKTKKQEAKATLSEVIKEMAKPRVAESAREVSSEWRSAKAVERRTR
jgi:TolA-binding protein